MSPNPSPNLNPAMLAGRDSVADATADAAAWDRRRLQVVLAGVVAVSVLLVAGLGYAGWRVLAGAGDVGDGGGVAGQGSGLFTAKDSASMPGHSHDGDAGEARGQQYRDRAAAAPMLEVSPAAATPPTADVVGTLGTARGAGVSAGPVPEPVMGPVMGPVMAVPTGVVMGPATVMTGFPRTPEGAVAQLAQIEVSVLQAMSLPVTVEVHAAWSLPGAVAVQQWALTGHVASFLAATADPATTQPATTDPATREGGTGTAGSMAGSTASGVKDPVISVTVTPVAGLIKALDGPDWVLACVLSTVSAVYQQHRETSLGHCERMQWAGGRWLIAPGPPPAQAPSTWPRTEAAAAAGWRPLGGAPETGVDTGSHR